MKKEKNLLDSLHSLEPPGANQIRTQGESDLVPNPGLSVSGPNSLSKRPFPHFQMQPSPQPAGVLPKHTRTLPCPSHLIPGQLPCTLQAPIPTPVPGPVGFTQDEWLHPPHITAIPLTRSPLGPLLSPAKVPVYLYVSSIRT